ncbi:MAG: type II toxin-antitoxin system HicB family antitoxin [Candidatus Wallbacteria bacterium]|nr:type II toxin-antitoxin system HicB family antitoxin [Candidatus Wallbacteria bacterium]
MTRKFTVVLEPGEDGFFLVSCPALRGCRSQGKSREEALRNIREAIEVFVESLEADGEPIPEEIAEYTAVEVEAA